MLSWQHVTKSKCQGEINHFQLCKVVLLLVNIIICFVKGDAMATGSGELASSLGGRGGEEVEKGAYHASTLHLPKITF